MCEKYCGSDCWYLWEESNCGNLSGESNCGYLWEDSDCTPLGGVRLLVRVGRSVIEYGEQTKKCLVLGESDCGYLLGESDCWYLWEDSDCTPLGGVRLLVRVGR